MSKHSDTHNRKLFACGCGCHLSTTRNLACILEPTLRADSVVFCVCRASVVLLVSLYMDDPKILLYLLKQYYKQDKN